jgi:hypothetical protein
MADDKKPLPPQKPLLNNKADKAKAKADAKSAADARKEHKESIKTRTNESSRIENKLSIQSKMLEAQTKIDKLNHMGNKDSAASLQALLDETKASFDRAPKTGLNIESRLKEVADVLDIANKESDKARIESVSSLQTLIDQNSQMKAVADNNPHEINRQLKELEKSNRFKNDEMVTQLRDVYESATAGLQEAIESGDVAAQQFYNEQLAAVKDGAGSEEERREANKLAEEANSRLFRIADGMEQMGKNFDEKIGEGARTVGFLAGLAGLALMFLDPETFQELMASAMDSITGIFDTLYAAITGDWEGFSSGFMENWKAISGILLSLGLMFGGKIFTLAGGLLKAARAFKLFMMTKMIPNITGMFSGVITALGGAFQKIIKGVVTGARVFRVFMMGTMIPAIGAMFTGMMTAMTPILAAMAPILLPILAIAAAFGLLFLGIKAIRDAMGFGSMFDVIKVAWGYVKDGMAMFANVYIDIANMIMGLVSKFGKWLGFDFEMPQMDRMATDNAEKAKEAARLNKKRLDEEKALEKEREIESELNAQNPTIPGSDILATSDSNAAGQNAGSGTVQAVITNATGGNTSTSNVINSSVVQTPITKATSTLASVTSR